MLKIGITGANSFIGTHLLEKLSRQNLTIHALSRTQQISNISYDNVSFYTGNLLDGSTLLNFIKGCDVVVNLAYLWEENYTQNLQSIENLAKICAANDIRRFIHCSTTSVYGNVLTDIVDEKPPCNPQTNYARTKLAIENYLLENYSNIFELAILRPTQVFGPRGKNLVKLADDLSQGSAFQNFLKSCLMAKRPMNLVCVDNVVGALDYLIHLNRFDNLIYIISDDEVEENYFHKVEQYLMDKLKIPDYFMPNLPLPLSVYKNFYRMLGKGTINPRTVYLGKNLADSGYIKPVSFKEGLTKFVNWYNSL